ncbi:MAG: heme lyase CcmF/NrfE family subunit [Actinobacteria bacterium]|nr:heme lyase CcmF/NrfE family subunit [Actinomycetota bacterium]
MIGLVGSSGLLTALVGAVGTAAVAGVSVRRPRARRHLRTASRVMGLGAVVALAALWTALLTDDFSIAYTAGNHARATPLLYTVATAWAGLEGSLLVWSGVLVGFCVLLVRQVGRDDPLGLLAVAVTAAITVFFLVMVAVAADPFAPVDPVPADGPGPNPLLQNHVLMAVHPPLLYLGYIGMTVPFAFGIGALILGHAGREWVARTRTWTLVAWTFLTAGILVGALWSYEVLGWGGYWAWDPVENASLLPWLTATGFLHSAIVQERRGLLRSWNVVLVLLTFVLTILGTFITRSGVVASVHSFTQSAVGPWLLGLLIGVSLIGLGLYAWRASDLDTGVRLDHALSREGAFLVNNLLLTFLAGLVLLGTMYPVLVEAFTGAQVSVGRPFFDRFAVPVGLVLLAAMGVGPLLPYRTSRPGQVWRRVRPALTAGAAAAAALLALGVRHPWVVLTAGAAGFVLASLVVDSARRRRRERGGARASLAARLGWWGGQVAHAGVAVIAVAIAVTGGLATSETVTLEVGDTAVAHGYELRFEGLVERDEPNRIVREAPVTIVRDGRELGTYGPSLNEFRNQPAAIGTPSVRTRPTEDLYLALRDLQPERIVLEVIRFPFMWLLWAGSALLLAGGAVAVAGRVVARRVSAAAVRTAEEVNVGG